jgi:hypothetical protein
VRKEEGWVLGTWGTSFEGEQYRKLVEYLVLAEAVEGDEDKTDKTSLLKISTRPQSTEKPQNSAIFW